MTDWMKYMKIQQLKRDHLNKSQVSRRLGLDVKTVNKYWDMTPEEYEATLQSSRVRMKKADIFKDRVLAWLEENPDMSSSQIYDWLKERYGADAIPFKKRSFRTYISFLREEYDIPKPRKTRDYEAVEDPPMGKQAQVDLGEILLETTDGHHRKVYGFGMVMANSRHKYIEWILHPWTTSDFVSAHIRAFQFYGGRPEEIVYDQDKVLAISENNGDIILTEGFQNYVNSVGFRVVLCRGADPESKGRIESVIKYAKRGFAAHRKLGNIDDFNDDCIAWLERTGNAEVHGTTKKIPAEVFATEKEYLIPVAEYASQPAANDSITYGIRKDNSVLYKSNRYRVPLGTYKPGKRANVTVEDGIVIITDAVTRVEYARHPLSMGKGELIGEPTRNRGDKSKTTLELEAIVENLFGGGDDIHNYLTRIHVDKTRYYRDQLCAIKKLFSEWDKDLIFRALTYCIEHELYSASDLTSAIAHLATLEVAKTDQPRNPPSIPKKYRQAGPPVRPLSEYADAMRRPNSHGQP